MKLIPALVVPLLLSCATAGEFGDGGAICVYHSISISDDSVVTVEFLHVDDCSLGGARLELEVSRRWRQAACLLSLPEYDWAYSDGYYDVLPYRDFVASIYDPERPSVVLQVEGEWIPWKAFGVESTISNPPTAKTPSDVCRNAADAPRAA